MVECFLKDPYKLLPKKYSYKGKRNMSMDFSSIKGNIEERSNILKGESLQARNLNVLRKDTHISKCRKDIYEYANGGVYAALEEKN